MTKCESRRARESFIGCCSSNQEPVFKSKLQRFPVIRTFANCRVMTYNVCFDGHNADNRHGAIIEIIAQSKANIVCLQEVTAQFLQKLLADSRIKAKYEQIGV